MDVPSPNIIEEPSGVSYAIPAIQMSVQRMMHLYGASILKKKLVEG